MDTLKKYEHYLECIFFAWEHHYLEGKDIAVEMFQHIIKIEHDRLRYEEDNKRCVAMEMLFSEATKNETVPSKKEIMDIVYAKY